MKSDKIQGKKRQVAIGDMNQIINIVNAYIQPPVQGSPDYIKTFATMEIEATPSGMNEGDIWAMVKTTGGITMFDGVNDRVVSHRFYIRYIPDITSEFWVIWNGGRYEIVSIDNLDERNLFLVLHCNLRGNADQSNTAE